MTPEQMKRVREIAENKARKFCIETNMDYVPNFMYMANIAILYALDDPLLKKDLTKFEPEWVSYGQGCEDGYAAAQEQAARVCEHQEADHCAAEIRAMKKEGK